MRGLLKILVGDLYWLDRFKDKRPNGHYVERVCDECHEKQRPLPAVAS